HGLLYIKDWTQSNLAVLMPVRGKKDINVYFIGVGEESRLDSYAIYPPNGLSFYLVL
ncbi:Uncharacterized protein APZ42_004554, partial [Daphnia magna]